MVANPKSSVYRWDFPLQTIQLLGYPRAACLWKAPNLALKTMVSPGEDQASQAIRPALLRNVGNGWAGNRMIVNRYYWNHSPLPYV